MIWMSAFAGMTVLVYFYSFATACTGVVVIFKGEKDYV